ncbi:MAG: ROK family transcriptional regulator [Rhodobacteraceae bacterium]|nr:ROK family transcriptional regulator [Paracoccaceae bacterium]
MDTKTDFTSGSGPLLVNANRAAKPLSQQVLERIRAAGRISRSDVAKDLGVSPGSVTAIVAGLMDAGLVRENPKPLRDTARGRPPVELSLCADARHVVGMTLRDGIYHAVVTDFTGQVIAEAALSFRFGGKDVDELMSEMNQLLDKVLAPAGLDRAEICGIGVGLPGFIDHETGFVHWSPILREKRVALGAAMLATFPCPVHLDNDVNLLAMAELWFGMGRELANFAVVTIENGVGMGLILDNRIYRGARGIGLEIGHTTVQLDGALCRCGQRGCLEAYVADYALVREASTALDWDPRVARSPQQALEILFDQAKAGNEAARTIFGRAGRYLSTGLANVIRMFDPELLILSGARLRYDFLYAEEVLADMHRFSDWIGRDRTRIAVNTWGDLVWARGAAALALSAETDAISAMG